MTLQLLTVGFNLSLFLICTEARHNEAMRLLLPPGKDAPPPLGGQDTSRKILTGTMNRPEHQLMSRISILMLCCSTMLTSTYPIQVSYNLVIYLLNLPRMLEHLFFPMGFKVYILSSVHKIGFLLTDRLLYLSIH